MKRIKKILACLLSLFVLLWPMRVAAAESDFEENPFAIQSVTDESEEKLFRFNAYYTPEGEIGVALEPVKEEILGRGEIFLAASAPDSKIPLYNDFLPESEYKTAIQGLLTDKEYTVCMTQRVGDIEYLYHGTFTVTDDGGALSCTSFLFEDKQQAMDSLTEYLPQADSLESNVQISQIDETELPWIQPYDDTLYESEPNGTWNNADYLQSGDTVLGKISPSSDVDWYRVIFYEPGNANFWLGSIPSGFDYDLQVYEGDGTSAPILKYGSYQSTGQELIENKPIIPFKKYYIKVYSISSSYSNSYYKVAARLYPDGTTTPVYTKKLIGGVSNITYYVMDTTYAGRINDAFYDWKCLNFGGSKLFNVKRETNSSNIGNAQLIFSNYYSFREDIFGETFFYSTIQDLVNDQNPVNQNTKDWRYAKIYLYKENIGNNDYANPAGPAAVAAHEIGHAFGLDHANDNPYSIMCQIGYGRKTYQPSKTDAQALAGKY